MKPTDSHLKYFNKNSANYDLKYSILKHIITKHIQPNNKIAELFGGMGITTNYILKYANPHQIFITEINLDCFEYLQNKFINENKIELSLQDANLVLLDKLNKYQYIFLDNNLTPKNLNIEYSNLYGTLFFLNQTKNFIITETGIYNLSFTKNLTKDKIQKHFEELNLSLNNFNIYIIEVYYTKKFSIIYASNNPNDKIKLITEWTDTNTEWEQFLYQEAKRKLRGLDKWK